MEDRLTHIPTLRGYLYSHLLIPRSATSCVVVCSSILGEFEANYHRERLLASALADSGIAVVRFHYSGEGNSFGSRESMSLESMTNDGRAVISHVSQLGYERRAYVGTRVGCFVAGALSVTDPDAPLVFWEPVDEGSTVVREAKRKRRMSHLTQAAVSSPPSLDEETAPDGTIDLFGYDVYPPLLESLDRVRLSDVLSSPARPIFVARFGLSNAKDPVPAILSAQGFTADLATFDISEAWWYQSEHEPDIGGLVTKTAEWIVASLIGES